MDANRDHLIWVAARHGPEGWAEDVTHDAWIKVQGGEIGPNRPLRTDEQLLDWFIRVVRNEARNRRRTEAVRYHIQLAEIEAIAVERPAHSDPLLGTIVANSIRELPPAQRKVMELCCEGWTLARIAEMTERSVGTVKQHWHRGKEKLRTGIWPHLDP